MKKIYYNYQRVNRVLVTPERQSNGQESVEVTNAVADFVLDHQKQDDIIQRRLDRLYSAVHGLGDPLDDEEGDTNG